MLYRAIGLVLDSVIRWMGQDKPTQLDPLERASLNHWWFILPHPPEDGDRSSLRNVVVFFVFHIQDDG
jgi:Fic family protein